MCVPTKPAGCTPANSATSKLLPVTVGSSLPASLQMKVLPSVSLLTTFRPAKKASFWSAMITAGSAARGWVSIAVTNIELGLASSAGTRLKGLVLSAVHKPDLTNCSLTCSPVSSAS